MSVEATQRPAASTTARGPALGTPPIQWLPYLLLLPSLAIICLIELYPFIQGVIYSLHKGTLLGTAPSSAFRTTREFSVLRTSITRYGLAFFALFNVTISYVLGLALALFLNLEFPGRGIIRVLLLLP